MKSRRLPLSALTILECLDIVGPLSPEEPAEGLDNSPSIPLVHGQAVGLKSKAPRARRQTAVAPTVSPKNLSLPSKLLRSLSAPRCLGIP
eukprot:4904037-Alexandrium_andersonii.AAC.1